MSALSQVSTSTFPLHVFTLTGQHTNYHSMSSLTYPSMSSLTYPLNVFTLTGHHEIGGTEIQRTDVISVSHDECRRVPLVSLTAHAISD